MDTLLIEYEDVLIGRSKHIDPCNFYVAKDAGDMNEVKALQCFRYAIEEILEWGIDEAINKFDTYIINLMKLDTLLTYINFPVEVPYGDAEYILYLLYPDKIKLNKYDLVLKTYKAVLNSTDNKQFPREYFVGGDGFQRYCFCLKYIIENEKSFSSIEEIYDFFDSSKGKDFLDKFRLKTPAYQFYISIYDAIHNITRDNKLGDFWYYYKTFENACKKKA